MGQCTDRELIWVLDGFLGALGTGTLRSLKLPLHLERLTNWGLSASPEGVF